MNRLQTWKCLSVLPLVLAGVTGCNDPQIQTYRVAKEEKAPVVAPVIPHLHWDLPAGWVEQQPDRMRVASFLIRNDAGNMAQVAVIPLPGVSDIELESLNMWREELGLEPLTREKLADEGEPAQLGDTSARLYEMVNSEVPADAKVKNRIIGAMTQREGIFWFVKMAGEDELVASQKAAFLQFLKSLQFHAGSHGPAAVESAPVSTNTEKVPAETGLPNWKTPPGWKAKPPGPMLTAAFTASGPDATQADVTISKLSGDGGGLVANVNRWRGQLGLEPASESIITSGVEWLEFDGAKSYLVDLKGTNVRTGQPARMLAVGVPRQGETWFYKFMGDESVIEKEKAAFIQFIQSAY